MCSNHKKGESFHSPSAYSAPVTNNKTVDITLHFNSQVYEMDAQCSNCYHSSTVTIPRGTLAADYKTVCPNCGCDTKRAIAAMVGCL